MDPKALRGRPPEAGAGAAMKLIALLEDDAEFMTGFFTCAVVAVGMAALIELVLKASKEGAGAETGAATTGWAAKGSR
jgi:hypothetical protein